jgi:DNA-binding PadR family transcriptional regulator
MSTRLVILGLLQQKPLYGYEIKQLIEERMGDWTSIAFGSIYFALDKLTEEGFAERIAIEQAGSRPSRSVYQITEAGRTEFLALLRQVWRELERQQYAVDLALFFVQALPLEEVKGYLDTRIVHLEAMLQKLTDHRAEQLQVPEIPRLATAIFDHSLAHLGAELAWTKDLLDKVHRGAYP